MAVMIQSQKLLKIYFGQILEPVELIGPWEVWINLEMGNFQRHFVGGLLGFL